MPKCKLCNQEVTNKEDLALVRGEDDRWLMVCKECAATSGGEAEKKSAAPGAAQGNADDAKQAETPPRAALGPAKTSQEAYERLQGALETLIAHENKAKKTATHVHDRVHERKEADLRIAFLLLRDDTRYEGRVRDISQGGLRFVCDRELDRGQVLTMDISGTHGDAEVSMIQAAGEVRRVSMTRDGRFEVGVRFVRRGRANEPNRRRFRRHDVKMNAYYKRDGCEYTASGRVLDISQGGVRLILDESPGKEEEFDVTLRGESGAFVKADLCGRLRCVRIQQLPVGEWEIGCAFVSLQTKPRPLPEEDEVDPVAGEADLPDEDAE